MRGDLDLRSRAPAPHLASSWFEVNSFDFDLEGHGLPGGWNRAKAAFSPLTLTLDSNTALAPLLAMAATGESPNGSLAIEAATLIGVRSDGQTVSYRS